VHVRRSRELVARRAELDDFAGTMTRLREAYDAMNQTWPVSWSPDDLVDAMQTGDRLSYHPELAGEQLTHLRAMLPKVAASTKALEEGSSEQQRQALAERLRKEYKSEMADKIVTEYQNKLSRAKAALADVPGAQP
jgi:alpha-glucosidase